MLIGLLLILALPVAAQRKVKFGIFDKATEQPIIGAVITYADNEKLKSPQRVVTNMDGEATISVPQSDKCYYQVVSVGYNPLRGTIGSDSSLKLFMTEDVMKVNEVVVTGSRTARPIKLSPVSTQVIGGKELVDAGYADLTKALQQETPGMNIQKVGFGNEISMQGLDARHVLFLQDGERLTGDMAGNLDYERFNLHAIDRIEIVKGASSTLYGSRASGAVINLITKKTTKPIDIQAGVRWGQMNETNYKNPEKKDFLYMFEKNADRPNLQSWVSAGFNAGKVTSQTDVWYSSSDAFYMYQAENDKKVYTQEANPWLDHDVTITSVASRPPMGIEGTEHISVSQKVFYDPFKNLEILAYGSAFYMNTYDLIQDMTFSQARDWTAGTKIKYSFKDWFKITASLHGDFYDRFKRHERIDERTKVYKSRIFQPRLSITSQKFEGHDLILTSGGVSVGEEDHVKPAVEAEGSLDMWKIAIKPGKPLAFGKIRKEGGHAWFIGLPGNPVAAFVTCLMMVRPFVMRLQGIAQVTPRILNLPCASAWNKPDGARLEFLRGRINEAGAIELYRNQGSAVATSLCWSDGLILNPPGNCIAAGDTVRFVSFAELLA